MTLRGYVTPCCLAIPFPTGNSEVRLEACIAGAEAACVPDTIAEQDDERPSDAMMDLEPRVDISPQLTDSLLAGFTEPKWNDRKAAVDSVENILRSARVPLASGFTVTEPLTTLGRQAAVSVPSGGAAHVLLHCVRDMPAGASWLTLFVFLSISTSYEPCISMPPPLSVPGYMASPIRRHVKNTW